MIEKNRECCHEVSRLTFVVENYLRTTVVVVVVVVAER